MLNLYTVGLKNTADLRLYFITLHYDILSYIISYFIKLYYFSSSNWNIMLNYFTYAAVRNFKIVLEYEIQFDHPPVVWFCLKFVPTKEIKHVGTEYQTARHSNIVSNTDNTPRICPNSGAQLTTTTTIHCHSHIHCRCHLITSNNKLYKK